jgi:uncharacterized membrane protein YfcA
LVISRVRPFDFIDCMNPAKTTMEYLYLCGLAFLAGLIDAMAGGGGLIQLPALFLFLPADLALNPSGIFGTNKFSSICGTGLAVLQYRKRITIPWPVVMPAAVVAFIFSFLGAQVVANLSMSFLKPLVLVLLVLVAIFTILKPDMGRITHRRNTPKQELWIGIAVGCSLGFYDGFFGPGTGSFLTLAFVGLIGLDFLAATASAKVVNFSTNLSAVMFFTASGSIYYAYALPMAACNMSGAYIGTRLAVWKGSRFVRVIFLGVILAMIARFGWEVFLK